MELQTIGSKTYEDIRDQILRRTLLPGAILPQRRLAREMGIGTNSLREALVRLECDGLIESVPKWGARVKVWDAAEIRALYELREAVECQVARLCAVRASDDQLAALRAEATGLDRLYDHPPVDYARIVPMDARFHEKLAECADSRYLAQEHRRLNLMSQMARLTATRAPDFQHESQMHSRLLEPLSARDVAAAEEAMRHHMRHSLDNALAALKAPTSAEAR